MAGHVSAPKSVLSRYKQSLEDLTFNSKPLIDDLTRAAGQMEAEGDQIIEIIRSRIIKVRPEWKLPSLYLMDSIMKNLKGSFLKYVSGVIVGVFCHCFEKLTEPEPRKSLYKLRTTWTPFLPKHKLAAIDRHVHALDPNWPVVAVDNDPASTTIYVNPKFVEEQADQVTASIQDRRKALLEQTKQQRQQQQRVMGLPPTKDGVKQDKEDVAKHELLETPQVSSLSPQHKSRARSASPLPLHTPTSRANKSASPPHAHPDIAIATTSSGPQDAPPPKRIKADTNGRYTEQIKQSHLQLDDLPPELLPKHHENMLKRIERQINAGDVTPEQRATLVSQLNQLYELQKLKSNQESNHTSSSVPVNDFPVPNPAPLNSNLEPLHSKRRPYAGRFSSHTRGGRPRPYPWPASHRDPHNEPPRRSAIMTAPGKDDHPLKIPNLSLTPATLKQRYSSVIALLHSGDPCSSCGMRFMSNAGDLYRLHLNWHYKVNREEKEGQGKTSRNWFLHPDDWVDYEELADNSAIEMSLKQPKRESPVSVSLEKAVEGKPEVESCSVRAGDASDREVCAVCNEPFEQFWEEEEEAWHFRDAVRSHDRVYHTFCYNQS